MQLHVRGVLLSIGWKKILPKFFHKTTLMSFLPVLIPEALQIMIRNILVLA